MIEMRTFLCFVFLFVLPHTSLAQNAFNDTFRFIGPDMPSSFSGRSNGPTSDLILNRNAGEALYRVYGLERSDDPCDLIAHFRRLSNYEGQTQLRFSACHNNASKRQGKENSEKRTHNPYGGVFVTGIRVCLNNNKVKGIGLIGNYGRCITGNQSVMIPSKVRQDLSEVLGDSSLRGTVGVRTGELESFDCNNNLNDRYVSPYFERTNCPGSQQGMDNDWETAANCPNGFAATGLRLSAPPIGSSGRRAINGIALICRQLELVP